LVTTCQRRIINGSIFTENKNIIMELITFDSKTYKELVSKIERITAYIDKCETPLKVKETTIWLDSHEIVGLLKISKRTLQRLRENDQISYAMPQGKCLYQLSEVEKLIKERILPSNPKTREAFREKYMLQSSKPF